MLQRNYQSSPGQGSSVAKSWVPPAAGTIPLVDALAPVLALLRNRGRAAHQQNYQSSPGQGSSVGVTWVPVACGAIPLVDSPALVCALLHKGRTIVRLCGSARTRAGASTSG